MYVHMGTYIPVLLVVRKEVRLSARLGARKHEIFVIVISTCTCTCTLYYGLLHANDSGRASALKGSKAATQKSYKLE